MVGDRRAHQVEVVDHDRDRFVQRVSVDQEGLEGVLVDLAVEGEQVERLGAEPRRATRHSGDRPLPEADRIPVGGVSVEPGLRSGGQRTHPLGEQRRLARSRRADHQPERFGAGLVQTLDQPGSGYPHGRHRGRGELRGGEPNRATTPVHALARSILHRRTLSDPQRHPVGEVRRSPASGDDARAGGAPWCPGGGRDDHW